MNKHKSTGASLRFKHHSHGATPAMTEREMERMVRKKLRQHPAYRAQQALEELFSKAIRQEVESDGWQPRFTDKLDPAAIQQYALLICDHVARLNSRLASHPEAKKHLLQMTRKQVAWPMRISLRKAFSDDVKGLLSSLQVAAELPYANDLKARFNPHCDFGRVAMDLIGRIEGFRGKAFCAQQFPIPRRPEWAYQVDSLPQFPHKNRREDCNQWRAFVRKVLEDDLRDPRRRQEYRSLITAPSHQHRWKSVLINKIEEEFDSIWRCTRTAK